MQNNNQQQNWNNSFAEQMLYFFMDSEMAGKMKETSKYTNDRVRKNECFNKAEVYGMEETFISLNISKHGSLLCLVILQSRRGLQISILAGCPRTFPQYLVGSNYSVPLGVW